MTVSASTATFILYCLAIAATAALVGLGKVPAAYLAVVLGGIGLHASTPTGTSP